MLVATAKFRGGGSYPSIITSEGRMTGKEKMATKHRTLGKATLRVIQKVRN